MAASATSTAAKLAALMANATPEPNAPIVRPATAGPTTRAALNIAELRATALPMSPRPTISTTKLWRTGMSIALAVPRSSARTMIIQTSTTPVSVSTARIAARTIITACTTKIVWRFGSASASTPPNRPKTMTGTNCAAATTPSQNASLVSSRTSQAWATCCIHVPISEMSWPPKNSW